MRIKKLLSAFLAVTMVLGLITVPAFASETITEITTVDDLLNFAEAVNAGDKFAGKTVKLTADIDLAGIQWQPIGGGSVYFAGEFDGNNKTISNLTNTEDVAIKGLFGLVEKCYIHDLTLKDVKFSGNTTGARVGALAGNLQYYNVIENVVVDGLDYELNDTNGLIGGLAGYSWTSYVKNCTVRNADMNITSEYDSAVGVMIAYGRGVSDARTNFPYADKIAEADYQGDSVWNYVDSKVENATVNLSGTVSFGGFLGVDTYNHWRNYAKNNTVTGLNVTCAEGDGVYTVGGFMSGQYGGSDPAALLNNSVTGTITSNGTNPASTFGGFIGYKGGRPGGVTNCTADVDITVSAGDIGGFVGETQQYFGHEYKFDDCEATGNVATDEGTAGGFIGNIQHGGNGSALNVVINNSSASGTVNGTIASGFIGTVNDNKNGTATGGTVTLTDCTPTKADVTGETSGSLVGGNNTEIEVENQVFAAEIAGIKYETLAAAITAANSGDIIEVADGTHTMPGSVVNKNITIKGSKYVVIEMLTAVGANGSTIAFEGVTVKFDNDVYEGLQHSTKVTYTNCAHIGTEFLYAPTVSYINCTFEMYDAVTEYSVWTYGASDVTFTDCVFNTNGKAILVYNESTTTDFVADIELTNCKFNSNGTYNDKAAVELGQTTYGVNTYNLSFTNCTADTFVETSKGTPTGSKLWGNKDSMATGGIESGKTTVTIDGLVVTAPVVAKIGEVGYETLAAAIEAAETNDIITLVKDCNIALEGETYADRTITLPDGVTIDLGGKTLTVPFQKTLFAGENITIKNGTITTGALENYGLYIMSGSFNIEDVTTTNGINVQAGKVILNNVNSTCPNNYYAVYAGTNADVTINSGSYKTVINEENLYADGKITVFGGTFSKNPSKFVAEGYEAVENTDGTYTVKAIEEDVETIDTKIGYIPYVEDNTPKAKLFAGVDSLDYASVGFEVIIKGVKLEFTTKTVYTSITANYQGASKTFAPAEFSDNATYIFAGKLAIPVDYAGEEMLVRPFVINFDQTYTYGTQYKMNVSKITE